MKLSIFIGFLCICMAASVVEGFLVPSSIVSFVSLNRRSKSFNLLPRKHHNDHEQLIVLKSAPDDMHWFVKTEQFCKPFPEVKPHLEAHREWVRSLRGEQSDNTNQGTTTQQQTIVSGYRVDENDRPGGGGLMIFAAKDYESAEKFVRNDPLVANECVDWQLNKWIAETGDITIE